MGAACCKHLRPLTIEEIVERNRLTGEAPDYPRAGSQFNAAGAPEFAILCWLAADRSHIAVTIYEKSGFGLIDNRISEGMPVWRMIVGMRMGDYDIFMSGMHSYRRHRNPLSPWVDRILASLSKWNRRL